MSAPHRDRLPAHGGPAPQPLDLPVALATMALHRDLIEHVHQLTWKLTAGDFEALVIWCELTRQRKDQPDGLPRPLPLHDLVAATAIPRETVRRKLARLAALGRVARLDRGWVMCSGPIDLALHERARQTARQARDELSAQAAPALGHAPAGRPDSALPPSG